MHYTINDIIGPQYGGEQCAAEFYEDNGGGLHLFLLDEGGFVLYGEYDRDVHNMAQSWAAIMQGSDPFEEGWGVDSEQNWQADYDSLHMLVADSEMCMQTDPYGIRHGLDKMVGYTSGFLAAITEDVPEYAFWRELHMK